MSVIVYRGKIDRCLVCIFYLHSTTETTVLGNLRGAVNAAAQSRKYLKDFLPHRRCKKTNQESIIEKQRRHKHAYMHHCIIIKYPDKGIKIKHVSGIKM